MNYPVGVTMVLGAGLFWSFVPLGVRSLDVADVWQILFYRSIGLLPLIYFLISYQSGGNAIRVISQSGASGFFGAIGLVAAYAGGIAAVLLTTIANAAFLFATAPFLAALLGWLILNEPIRKTTLIALVIAMIGILFMVADSVSRGNWLGDALALLSALGFAVFTIALRAGKNHNSMPVVFIGGVLSILLAGVMSFYLGNGLVIPVAEIALAVALGAFVLGIGMILCTLGSKVVPAAELALLCMTEIVFAPIWAWLFINEVPGSAVITGGCIVVFAIVLNALTGIRSKPVIGPNY